MKFFVLDTNIISFYLKGNETIESNIIRTLTEGNSIVIAPIAYYEIKRGLMAINASKRLKEFAKLCELFGIGQLDNSIMDLAVEIYVEQRRAGRMIEDADIFIAAFCKKQNCTLVTNNTKHFKNIHDLSLTDWSVVY
jgi:predicted nucleic acid-binding protein